ncbi:hypothetical protein J5226_17990 [Lysobacter sp. K5869]|uniref:hypothetical protein n=1 Tax=Lysobacter sp. K5869 TaxID=2820808 RepID=UPI001C0616B7|nr:hypothetical protein [Lysobacter sp. K5869]QWP75492.1 hypothetical protein J5226_17990 [Lysobacter sp. K5869]
MSDPRARAVVARRAASRGAGARGAFARAALAVALLGFAAALPAQRRILPASKPAPPPCVQVRIGHDEAGRWDCINEAIKSEVDKVAPNNAADSPGERLAPIGQGLAVPAATRQRLGNQYGKSITPQRPERVFPATPLSRPPGH